MLTPLKTVFIFPSLPSFVCGHVLRGQCIRDWLDHSTLEAGAIISPILLLGKLRLREVKNLTQKCQSGFELGVSDSKVQCFPVQGEALRCCMGPLLLWRRLLAPAGLSSCISGG